MKLSVNVRFVPHCGTTGSFLECPLSAEADVRADEIGAMLSDVCFHQDRTFSKIGSMSELRTKQPLAGVRHGQSK